MCNRCLFIFVISLIVLLTGCASKVKIRDATGDWNANSQYFHSDLTFDDDIEIDEVWVSYTRHLWPGSNEAHKVIAEETNSGKWRAFISDAPGFWKADSLFYIWTVRYREDGQTVTKTASSVSNAAKPHRRVVGCTAASIENTLNQVFQVMNLLREQSGEGIHQAYSNSPAHLGPVSLLDQGVPYSHTATVGQTVLQILEDQYRNIKPDIPALLLYSPQSNDLSEITDGDPDEPYALTGAAYGVEHVSAKRRPRMGCIPSENWFLHEAGYHLRDGGFSATAPNEDFPGQVPVALPGGVNTPELIPGTPPYQPDPAPEVSNPISNLPAVWHPRLWDLHFWFSEEAESGVVMTINRPGGQSGLETPNRTFFYSGTFE